MRGRLASSRRWRVAGCVTLLLCAGCSEESRARLRARFAGPDAQFALGQRYALGEGVAQQPAEARRWYRRAADEGHAGAQLALAESYAGKGQGSVADPEEAVRWYRAAAEAGVEGGI